MKRGFLYVLSILGYLLGGLLWLGFVRLALMAVIEILLCVRFPSQVNFENTAGDALAALVIFLLAWWLTRVGRRNWTRAIAPANPEA
jgi:hypothetical protein